MISISSSAFAAKYTFVANEEGDWAISNKKIRVIIGFL